VLEAVLVKVGIWSIVSVRGGLDAAYLSMGFSTGQQQLFCLARALLHKSRLILLDEATSSVDKDTDSTIRSLMRKEFKDSTVIEVVHRFDTFMDYDVLVVMKDGGITE
jgi:ABC-type multidrug transport system fused ATPase/permease subunit